MPMMSGFRWEIADASDAIITFEAGDKCTLQVVNPVNEGSTLLIDVVANDDTYMDYIVWIEYLDPGKTLEDMKLLTDPINPPAWLHIVGAILTTPMSRAAYGGSQVMIDKAQGPIYFTCQADGPVPRKFIDHVGPLTIEAAP